MRTELLPHLAVPSNSIELWNLSFGRLNSNAQTLIRRFVSQVISRTFTPFVDVTHQLPERLVPDLIHRFSSSEGYSIYPDVKPFFDMLQQVKKHGRSGSDWPWSSTTVGVITNSDDRIPGILESLGLSVGRRSIEKVRLSPQDGAVTDVSFVVLSYDVGCEKPDTRIFDAAKAMFREALSTEAGVDVSTGFDDFTPLYVGDELEKDVLGAIAAGWYPVLLDREGKYHERMITVRTGVTDSPYTRQFVPVMHDLRDLRFWRTS